MSIDYITYELDMSLGWALISWALENDGWLQFAGLKRSSKGYIAMEVDKLEKEYFDKYPKS